MIFRKIMQLIQKKIRDRRMKLQGWRNHCEHGVPADWAFEHYGAVFQGGICSICDKLNQGKFLGNVSGMNMIVDGKSILCEGRPLSYFRELGWKIGFIA